MKHAQKMIAASTVITLLASPISYNAEEPESFFKDVPPSSKLYSEIYEMFEEGKVAGFSDGTFRPKDKITRGQSAKILADVLELSRLSNDKHILPDVSADKWYYESICKLIDHGIMSGFDDGTFRPEQTLTRAEAARIISEAFELKATEETVNFSDIPAGKWYASYVKLLVNNNITTGKTPDRFAPGEPVTREEMIAFINRALKQTVPQTVESIDEDEIIIGGETYGFSEELEKFFNKQNELALTDAIIEFEAEGTVITEVSSLILKNESDNKKTLDGNGLNFNGSISVEESHFIIKNLTIKENLNVNDTGATAFEVDQVEVSGEFKVGDQSENPVSKASIPSKTIILKAFKNNNTMIFSENLNIVIEGQSYIQKMALWNKATVQNNGGEIAGLFFHNGNTLDLSGTIGYLHIHNQNEFILKGNAALKETQIYAAETKFTLEAGITFENIHLQEGHNIRAHVLNYDSVRGNIQSINGVINADNAAPSPPVNSNPGPFQSHIETVPDRYGYVTLRSKGVNGNKIMYQQVWEWKSEEQLAKIGQAVPQDAVEYEGQPFLFWKQHEIFVYLVNKDNKVLDVKTILNNPYDFMEMTYQGGNEFLIQNIWKRTLSTRLEDTIRGIEYYNQDGMVSLSDQLTGDWDLKDGLSTKSITIPDYRSKEFGVIFTMFGDTDYYEFINEDADFKQKKAVLNQLAHTSDQSGVNRPLYIFNNILRYVVEGKRYYPSDIHSKIHLHEFFYEKYKEAFIENETAIETIDDLNRVISNVNRDLQEDISYYYGTKKSIESLFDIDPKYGRSLKAEVGKDDIEALEDKMNSYQIDDRIKQDFSNGFSLAWTRFYLREYEQFINSVRAEVTYNGDIGIVEESLFTPELPEEFVIHIGRIGTEKLYSEEDGMYYVRGESEYLYEYIDNKIGLKKPNRTGQDKTEYMSVSMSKDGYYLGSYVIPVVIKSIDKELVGNSDNVNISFSQNDSVLGMGDDGLLLKKMSRLESVLESLRAQDFSKQTYEIFDKDRVSKNSGYFENGDLLRVTAENGKAVKEYLVHSIVHLENISPKELGIFNFNAENTNVEELYEVLRITYPNTNYEIINLTEVGKDSYRAEIEGAPKDQQFFITTHPTELSSYTVEGLNWRSYILQDAQKDEEGNIHVKLKGNLEDLNPLYFSDTKILFTSNNNVLGEERITIDGVTLEANIISNDNNEHELVVTLEGIDGGESNGTIDLTLDIMSGDYKNDQLLLTLNGNGKIERINLLP